MTDAYIGGGTSDAHTQRKRPGSLLEGKRGVSEDASSVALG